MIIPKLFVNLQPEINQQEMNTKPTHRTIYLIKKTYEKPAMAVHELQDRLQIICASDLGGNNPFQGGIPENDR